ncbi:MAG: hypothetical protein SynsKO_18060 [Synoicihabitans sp.]
MSKQTPAPTTSPWARMADSAVHGYGLYASKDIPKGTQVIEYVGEKITKAESDRRDEARRARQDAGDDGCVYLFILNKRYDIDGDVPWNTARLINHSCDPNCETEYADGGIWISSTRDIAAGEELSYDYGFDWENWEEHPCLCGAPTCCGYIIDKTQRWRVRRELARRKAEKTGEEISEKKSDYKHPLNPMGEFDWGDLLRLKARLTTGAGAGRTLAIAESLTAGQLQARIGLVSGASKFFKGGITAYTIAAKVAELGVEEELAETTNGVSVEVATQMAEGIALKLGASIGIATTGYAEADPEHGAKQPYAFWAIAQRGLRGNWEFKTGRVGGKGLSRVKMQAKVVDKVIAAAVKSLKIPARGSRK